MACSLSLSPLPRWHSASKTASQHLADDASVPVALVPLDDYSLVLPTSLELRHNNVPRLYVVSTSSSERLNTGGELLPDLLGRITVAHDGNYVAGIDPRSADARTEKRHVPGNPDYPDHLRTGVSGRCELHNFEGQRVRVNFIVGPSDGRRTT